MRILREKRMEVARKVYENAINAGVEYEALAILETNATYYNPTTAATEKGDIYCQSYGQVQVKAFDGRPAFDKADVTGDLRADAIKAIQADVCSYFMVWQSETQYVMIPKEVMIELVTKFTLDVIRYAPCDKKASNRSPLRFKLGPQKNKILLGYGIRVKKTAVKGLI